MPFGRVMKFAMKRRGSGRGGRGRGRGGGRVGGGGGRGGVRHSREGAKYPPVISGCDYLPHLVNTSRGTNKNGKMLSAGMFAEFPKANCYRDGSNTTKSPGTYELREVNKNGTKYVVNVFAQTHHAGHGESEWQKQKWFAAALTKLAYEIEPGSTIAFPEKGREWNRVYQDFASSVGKGVKVFTYPYSGRARHGRQLN